MSATTEMSLTELRRYFEWQEAYKKLVIAKYGKVENLPYDSQATITAGEASWILVSIFILHPWVVTIADMFFDIVDYREAVIAWVYANSDPRGFVVCFGILLYSAFGTIGLAMVGESIRDYVKKHTHGTDVYSRALFDIDARSLFRTMESGWEKEDKEKERRAKAVTETVERRKREERHLLVCAWIDHCWDMRTPGLGYQEPSDEFKYAFERKRAFERNPAMRIVDSLPSLITEKGVVNG